MAEIWAYGLVILLMTCVASMRRVLCCCAKNLKGEAAQDGLPTVVVPIVVTVIEPEPAAVMVSIAVFDMEIPVAVAFVSLCGTLQAGESQVRTDTECENRTHGKRPFGVGEGGDVRPYELERREKHASSAPTLFRRLQI